MSDIEQPMLWQGPEVRPPAPSKIRKWLIIVAAVVAAPLFITFTALPQEIEVVRTVEIERSAHSLYALVSGSRSFVRWSPWSALDPNTHYTFSGPPIGVGAKFTWASLQKSVGAGSQTIIAATQNHLIVSAVEFAGTGSARSEITIDPYVQSSVVTWRFRLDTKLNPLLRWAGVLGMKKAVGADYEKGLANLKKLALSEPERDFSGLLIDGVINDGHPALRAETAPGANLDVVKTKLEAFRQTAGLNATGPIHTAPYLEKPKEQIVYLPVH